MVGQINNHLYRKRGVYNFYRRLPKALLAHYSKPRIVRVRYSDDGYLAYFPNSRQNVAHNHKGLYA